MRMAEERGWEVVPERRMGCIAGSAAGSVGGASSNIELALSWRLVMPTRGWDRKRPPLPLRRRRTLPPLTHITYTLEHTTFAQARSCAVGGPTASCEFGMLGYIHTSARSPANPVS